MKKIVIPGFFFSVFFLGVLLTSVFAQNQEELLKKLENTDQDTSRVNILNELVFHLASEKPEKAEQYAEKAIKLAKKINHQKGLATAYHNLGNAKFYKNEMDKALELYNSALKIRIQIDDKKGVASTYNNMANIYKHQGKTEKALKNNFKSLEISKAINDKKGIAYSYYNIGQIHDIQGLYKPAAEYFNKALSIFEQINDKYGIASCYNDMGNLHFAQGGYDTALDYYLKSLEINDELNQPNALARAYNNIGNVLQKQGKLNEALDYFEKSVEIKKHLQDERGVANTYNNIGLIYHDQLDKDSSNYEKALRYYQLSLNTHKKIENPNGIASSYANIGLLYRDINKFEEALEYYQKSLEISKQTNDKNSITNAYNGIGTCYKELGQNSKAIAFLEKGLELSKEINAMEDIRFSAKWLSQIYEQKKNYEKAFYYLDLFKNISDSIRSYENLLKINQLSMQYEFDKIRKKQEFEQKQKELAAAAELRQQKLLRNVFIIAFVLTILLVVYIFRSLRIIKKKNILLDNQKKEILLQNSELEQQKEEILAQRDEIERQRDVVFKQNQSITDSIVYAKRIQAALLPPEEQIEAILPEHFILFLPRDIVSGDFYWMNNLGPKFIVTAADCTGHGVPGAFMSMLGVAFLNEIVNQKSIDQAAPILNELRATVKRSLRQTGKENETKDGMDMALCIIDTDTLVCHYAGAYNPLYVVRNITNNENDSILSESGKKDKRTTGPYEHPSGQKYILIQLKADRMPIGIYMREKESFSNYTVQLKPGDSLYMFSDGYVDQFGGKSGKKFMTRPFKQLLLSIQHKSMPEQKEILIDELNNWKGERAQVDDILVMGIKV